MAEKQNKQQQQQNNEKAALFACLYFMTTQSLNWTAYQLVKISNFQFLQLFQVAVILKLGQGQ